MTFEDFSSSAGPTRVSCRVLQESPLPCAETKPNVPQECQQGCSTRVPYTRVSQKSDPVFYKSVPQERPTELKYKSVPQECSARVSAKSVPEECSIRVSDKSVLQECPTRVSHKSVLQECHLDICSFFEIVSIRVRGFHLVFLLGGRRKGFV